MSCVEHQCPDCGVVYFDNEYAVDCPECGSLYITNDFDEE